MIKPALKPPLIVFVFSRNRGENSTRFGGFSKRLVNSGSLKGINHKTIALEDLIFIVDKKQHAHVVLKNGESPFDDSSLVYFKSWESMPEEAAALAIYLESQGIPYIDSIVGGMGVGKLPQLMRIWSKGLKITPFGYGSNLQSQLLDNFLPSSKYVLKGAQDEKGQDNIIVHSISVADLSQEGKIVQPYIENKGDYRVLVYGFKSRGALFRQAMPGSHLNNTSAGAKSIYINKDQLRADISYLAESSSRATGHQIAGVDILPGDDGQLYVLEVNQGSQIVTGHFTSEKMSAFGEYISEKMQSRYIKESSRKHVIGRHVNADLPALNMQNIQGKVDTGAYSSTLCAKQIYVKNGILFFSPYISGFQYPECQTNDYSQIEVISSSGIAQTRYIIDTEIVIMGERFVTQITLTDRSRMKTPLLIGRKALHGRFIVNVELSRKAFEKSI